MSLSYILTNKTSYFLRTMQGMLVYGNNINTQEVEAAESGVQDQPQLHRKLSVSLSYTIIFL